MDGGYCVPEMSEVFYLIKTNLHNSNIKSRLCGFVFAHEVNEFSKSKIIPMVEYWNSRSQEYVDFYFLGYLGTGCFFNRSFIEAIEYFETNTKWEYNGSPTMLLCRSFINDNGNGGLDLISLIEIDFIQAEKNELIESVDALFESIIRSSKKGEFIRFDFDFLKQIYGKPLANSLIKTIFENLPIKNISKIFNITSGIKILSR